MDLNVTMSATVTEEDLEKILDDWFRKNKNMAVTSIMVNKPVDDRTYAPAPATVTVFIRPL